MQTNVSSSSSPKFLETFKAGIFLHPFRFHTQSRNFLNNKNPSFFASLKCTQTSYKSISTTSEKCPPSVSYSASMSVSEKVKHLAAEFKGLVEPVERVKRLLFYATLLPPFESSLKTKENRVKGCTAQVWLEVKMDKDGLMRFKVDSDSEITKGFCSCLIWVLDGGKPEEILSVEIDDLFDMNVGMPSRGNSRVNTWQNVLISMQKRTKDVIAERDRIKSLDASFSAVLVSSNCINVDGICNEARV